MKCKFESCNTHANYGYELKKPMFCAKHKEADMKDVNNPICKKENCEKRAFYGDDKPVHCRTHKNKEEINVVKGFCKERNCKKKPTFGNVSKKPLYCIEHKKDDMFNVMKQTCKYLGCTIQPTFGLTWNKPIYCKNHKNENLRNVISKRCINESCDLQPCYGYEWKKPISCFNHKLQDMKNINNLKCKNEDCSKSASFGEEWMKPLRCAKHRIITDRNVTHKSCKSELCDTIGNSKYKGYCLRCFIHIYPNENVSRQFKVKERYVIDYIKQQFSNENIIVDKIVDGGCSRKRPDIFIDKFTHVVIIECDENQHQQHYYSCDNKRLMELFQDFGFRPLVVIRFNPDKYIDNMNKKHQSCFSIHNKFDVPIVESNELKRRLEKLGNLTKFSLGCVPEKEITTHYMFYDNYNF